MTDPTLLGTELAVSTSGSGAPLVLLHGGGPGCSSTADFAAVLPALAAERTVHAVDLHNYGDSPDVAIDGSAPRHHATVLADRLADLLHAPADFVCQSLGGTVALRLAARRPDLVSSLVVTGSQPVTGAEPDSVWSLGPRVRAELLADGPPDAAGMRRLMAQAEWFAAGAIPADLVAARLDAVHRHADLPRGVPEDLTELLPAVVASTLLLWGAHDAFATPRYAVAVAELLPDAQVRVVPRAGHHVQSERPDVYARAALSFLNLPPTS